MKMIEYADLMYNGPHGEVTHWVPWGNPRALCGRDSQAGVHTAWYGTGSMDEWERAASLSLCSECASLVRS